MMTRSKLLHALCAGTAAFLFAGAAQASGANYWFLKAVPTLKPVAAAPAPVPPEIALSEGVLPEGMVGKAYSFDLRTLTQVTGGPGIASAQYALGGGTLPGGISLSSDGQLAGTPTAVTTGAGAGFTVGGTYVTATGQQAYTIKVGEATLEVVQVSARGSHTCAVTTVGGVKCWGYDYYGQLGNDAAMANKPTPVDVLGLTSGVASVSSGASHTCAVTTAGGLKCWGADNYGQLGNDTTLANQSTPVDVLGLTSGVASVSAGYNHTCAVTTAGGLKCWGWDDYGQLGNDVALASKPTPVDVAGLTSGVASVSTGYYHTCAVTAAGGAKCWGGDTYGQLGNDAALASKLTPVDVLGLTSGVVRVSVGYLHTCALTTAGGLKCWGFDSQGQLGNDAAMTQQPTPVDVAGLTAGVKSVAAGDYHACAVTAAGGLKCWGSDTYGQLGNDTALTSQPTPVDVAGLTSGVASVSAGASHTCAVTTAGGLKCWGSDSYGQLGNDAALAGKPTPVAVKPGP